MDQQNPQNKQPQPQPHRRSLAERRARIEQEKQKTLRGKIKTAKQKTTKTTKYVANMTSTKVHKLEPRKLPAAFTWLFSVDDEPTTKPTEKTKRTITIAGVAALSCTLIISTATVATHLPAYAKQDTCQTQLAKWQEKKNNLNQLTQKTDELIKLVKQRNETETDPIAGILEKLPADTLDKLMEANNTAKQVLNGEKPTVIPSGVDINYTKSKSDNLMFVGVNPLVEPNCETDTETQIQYKLSDVTDHTNNISNIVSPLLHNIDITEQRFYCTTGREIRQNLLNDRNLQLEKVNAITNTIKDTAVDLKEAKKLDNTRVEEVIDEVELDKNKIKTIEEQNPDNENKSNDIQQKLESLDQTPEINCSSKQAAFDTYETSVTQRQTINAAAKDIDQLNEKVTADFNAVTGLLKQARDDLNERQMKSEKIKQDRAERKRLEQLREQQAIESNKQKIRTLSIPELEDLVTKNRLPDGVTRDFIRDVLDERRRQEQEQIQKEQQRLAELEAEAILNQQRIYELEQQELERQRAYEQYVQQQQQAQQ